MAWPVWLAQPLPVSTGTYIGLVWALAWVPMLVMTWRHRQGARALILSPITALAGVGTAFVLALIAYYGLESGLGMPRRVSGHLWLLVMAPIGGFLFWWMVNYAKAPATRVLRGASVMDSAALVKQTRALKRKHGDSLLTLAGVFVNFDDEAKHFKIMGTTGSGKSTAIRELIGQALKRGDRAVIADPGGDYLSHYYDPARGDVILNPFDSRSVRWSLFDEFSERHEVDQLARSLIPAEDEWSGYARTLVSALIWRCHENRQRDVAELWRLVAMAPAEELRTVVAGTAAQPFLEEGNVRMFGSIRAVAVSALASLDYVQAQRGDGLAGGASVGLSVRDWIRSGRGVLFLPYQPEQIAALSSLIATWMRVAIFETMGLGEVSDPNDASRRLWFVVDELDALGRINGLKDALARLRKAGGRCVLGFQSIAQISSIYGAGEARTIVENCSNTLILRCSASEGGGTAEFASHLIGQREIIRETVSTSDSSGSSGSSTSTNYGQEHRIEYAVLASEIESLPDRQGYLKHASAGVWLRVGF